MPYNPFSKPIGSRIEEEDLQELLGKVSEGYYVEYKQTFRAPQKIAHSVASLANTYGGWYIVGITTDDRHLANDICGFSREEFPDPVMKVRDSIKNGIDPVPVFFPTPVHLANGRTVLVVYVPGEQRTPFVTSDGRIYRRNHDSSDPIAEASRHTVDRLFEQGREADQNFADFCARRERQPSSLPLRRDPAWVNLFLRPDPLLIVRRQGISEAEDIDRLLELSKKPLPFLTENTTGNIPFNMAQPTYSSVTLRQTANRLPNQPGITAEFTYSGSLRLNIPLFRRSLGETYEGMKSNRAKSAIQEVFRSSGDELSTLLDVDTLDVGELLLQVYLLLAFYREWLGDAEWVPGFRFAFSVRGVGSAVPFTDAGNWADQVERWGLPMLDADVQWPNSWQHAPVVSLGPDNRDWFPILMTMARELGLSDSAALAALSVTAVRRAGLDIGGDDT